MKRMNVGQETVSDGNTNVKVNYERNRAKRTETEYGANAYPKGCVPEMDENTSGYYSNNSAPPDHNKITVCRVKRRG